MPKLGPAVAGKNATVSQPVYKDWRSHQAHSAAIAPGILRQIQHIHSKAAEISTLAALKAEQSKAGDIVREDGSRPVEPAVYYDRAHPGDSTSPASADAYHSISIGVNTSSRHSQQHLDHSPRQIGGNFLPPSPAASDSLQEMQKQMKVKDKVITELAGIVEMLEINYGISIHDQADALQKLTNIAHSMKEDAREAENAPSPTNKTASKFPPPRST